MDVWHYNKIPRKITPLYDENPLILIISAQFSELHIEIILETNITSKYKTIYKNKKVNNGTRKENIKIIII